MEEVVLDIPPSDSTVDGQSNADALETIQEDQNEDREHMKKPSPSLRGSAKFARTRQNMSPSGHYHTPRVMITQQDQSDTSHDDTFEEEDFQFLFGQDDEYDTDLEMDIEQWLLEDRNQISNDFTGEKTYLAACESKGVTPVSYFIRHIEDSEVVLRFRGLGPTGTQALSRTLKKNNTIEKLDLEGNWIEANGCTSIADMLSENIYISDLILSENRTGNDGAIALCAILIKNDNINKLDLSGNVLTDASAESICEMLKKNTALKHLLLRHNNFEENGAVHFKEALATNESLETLDLSWNKFRTKGAIYIAEGIQENFGLRCLNFAMNGLGSEGAEAMGRALKVNRTLLQLDLSFNRIPEIGAGYLAVGLQTNDTLQGLKLSSNPIGSEGSHCILLAVEKNDSSALIYLEMFNIRVNDEFDELEKRLKGERDLTILHAGLKYETSLSDLRRAEPEDWWIRDPMTKLKRYVKENGYRLIDLFRDFDKDGNQLISKEEFTLGVKQAGIVLSEEQIDELLRKLDKDKNGSIDFGELIEGDREYKKLRREWAESKQKKMDDEKEKEKSESARDILQRLSVSLQGDRKPSVHGDRQGSLHSGRNALVEEHRASIQEESSQDGDTT
ncbi:hypothetical protein EGW08_006966 [Elysia chlorotica]|uniref:EF-hand domain-containing protein n=1 Tax=Elysia chlorotica TaxID=188477 RepID=A0A3S1BJH4_ELYCH|nr:hypothetical protein EGW08_006966 [Elysia chlorotica]